MRKMYKLCIWLGVYPRFALATPPPPAHISVAWGEAWMIWMEPQVGSSPDAAMESPARRGKRRSAANVAGWMNQRGPVGMSVLQLKFRVITANVQFFHWFKVHITNLSSLKTSVIDYNVRAEILSMGMGIDNPEHVEQLKKLREDAKIPACEESLSQTP